MMRTSPNGVAFIKQWEGFEPSAYKDIAGVWTIGYGHTGGFRDGRFDETSRLSDTSATALLADDLASRERAVETLLCVSVNQNEFDALVSLAYNIGVAAFRRSTVRRRLNAGDRVGAADAFTMWVKATINGHRVTVAGLVRRRRAERRLFLTSVAARCSS